MTEFFFISFTVQREVCRFLYHCIDFLRMGKRHTFMLKVIKMRRWWNCWMISERRRKVKTICLQYTYCRSVNEYKISLFIIINNISKIIFLFRILYTTHFMFLSFICSADTHGVYGVWYPCLLQTLIISRINGLYAM